LEAASGSYKNGAKNGVWIYKGKDGKITEKELFIDGRQATKKESDEYFSKQKSAARPTGTATPKPAPKTPKTGS
jgi:hypothetical protein